MTERAVLTPAALARGGVQAWLRAADALLRQLARHRARRRLEAMSDHMLKDVGVSRADVEGEMRGRPWRY